MKVKMGKGEPMPKFEPTIELHGGQVDGLEGLKLGDKCHIEIEAEVTATRTPAEYEKEKKGSVVTFKVKDGEVEPTDGKEYDKDYDHKMEMEKE